MLLSSIFSFSYNAFHHIEDKNFHFNNDKFAICKCFLKTKLLVFGKDLTLYSIDTHFNASAMDSF